MFADRPSLPRSRRRAIGALGISALVAALAVGPAIGRAQTAAVASGRLDVAVAGVRNARGKVHVDICTAEQFLKSCVWSGEAPATPGVTTVSIPNLPAGRYAAQVFHDENGSGEVERNFIGLPKEGVGFSGIRRKLLREPRFAETAFSYDGGRTSVPVDLHYYLR